MPRMRSVVAAGAVLALVASACGGGGGKHRAAKVNAASCLGGTIFGSGSTFVDGLVERWIKDYEARCRSATVKYQAVGSQVGIQQLTAAGVDFGASDAVLTADQEKAAHAKGGDVLHMPWSGGGVAVEFHLPGVKTLNLTADTLEGIFSGAITRWDDSALAADNPGVTLPATGIHVVYRSDDNPLVNCRLWQSCAVSPLHGVELSIREVNY